MVAVPVDDPAKPSKVFVIELAQPYRVVGKVGTATGVLIYSVDAKLATGQNQVVVYPKTESDLMHAPFQTGDTFKHKDAPVTVKVVKKNAGGSMRIEIEL